MCNKAIRFWRPSLIKNANTSLLAHRPIQILLFMIYKAGVNCNPECWNTKYHHFMFDWDWMFGPKIEQKTRTLSLSYIWKHIRFEGYYRRHFGTVTLSLIALDHSPKQLVVCFCLSINGKTHSNKVSEYDQKHKTTLRLRWVKISG